MSSEDQEIIDLMLADLRRSGLDESDASKMHLRPLTAEQTSLLTGRIKSPSYLIPYLDADNKVIDYYRLRLLNGSRRGPMGSKVKQRYYQQKDTAPNAYFSPYFDWGSIFKDVSFPIYLTEGEKKAAKGGKEGLPVIGIGGVWSWKSKKLCLDHIPEFDLINWKGRKVYLTFDSDLSTNPKVLAALHALANEIDKMGGIPSYVELPQVNDEKVGLDDYLVHNSVEDFLKIRPSDFGRIKALHAFNERYAVIQDIVAILDLKRRETMRTDALIKTAAANEFFTIINAKGELDLKLTAAEWIKWGHRREHEAIVYKPGQATITDKNEFNLWDGWPVEPVKGDVSLWYELLEYMLTFEKSHAVHEWIKQWMAYPIQNPGAKMFSAILIHGTQTGTGKSLIAFTLGSLYGSNFKDINRKALVGNFNEWAARTQFVLVDEVSSLDKRKDLDEIKNIITRKTVVVDPKYKPKYKIDDCINYVFTSQHIDAMHIEEKDRRFLIVESPEVRKPQSFYDEFDKWYKSKTGQSALMYHLLNEIDCSGFNPNAAPPQTTAKQHMIELSASNLDAWCRELREYPDNILCAGSAPIPCDLWTTEDLAEHYNFSSDVKVSKQGMALALRRAGFDKLKRCKVSSKYTELWMVRNKQKWQKAKPEEIVIHYSSRGAPQ